MLTIRKLLIASLVLGSCGLGFALYGQENDTKMYLEPKGKGEGEKEADSIYTGKVIAYGELLSAPYYVEFRNDTVWINDIPIIPPIRTFEEEQPNIIVSETRKLQQEISKQCFSDYMKDVEKLGVDGAKNMILNKYLADSLVEQIEFYPSSTGITIKFTDGFETHSGFFGEIRTDGKLVDYNRVATEEELIEVRKVELDMIRTQLSKGFLKIFGYCYGLDIQPGRAQGVINTLESIARGEQTYEQIYANDRTLLPSPRTFWKEFELKKDSWK